jgi:hypothetical protein
MRFSVSREPALYLFLVATAVRLFSAFILDVSTDTQALVNAVATAVASMIVAFMVKRDGQVPAILGVVQAILALAVGLGFSLPAEHQALIMSFVGGLAAAFVRTQVVASEPATGGSTVLR